MTHVLELLFNSLWASAIALLAAAFVLRIAKNTNATTRYAVWTAALVCSILLPLVMAAVSRTAAPVLPVPQTHVATSTANISSARQPIKVIDRRPAAASSPAMPQIQRAQFALAPALVLAVAILWALMCLYNGTRFAISVSLLESLKKNATPLPVEYRNHLPHWQAIAAASHRVRLCLSDEICVPVAVGIFDAMILLPTALVNDLDPDDVDRIVLHEYAHLRRGDDWINAFQRIVLALFFFNPAIRYIARQMDIEREVSCDDSVISASGDPLPMASCLVKMVEKVAWPYRPLAAPGVFDSRRNLSLRVERLLMVARDRRTQVSAGPAIAALVAMSALVLAGALVSPKFVYALPEQPKQIAAKPGRPVLPKAKAATLVNAQKKSPRLVIPASSERPEPVTQKAAVRTPGPLAMQRSTPEKTQIHVKVTPAIHVKVTPPIHVKVLPPIHVMVTPPIHVVARASVEPYDVVAQHDRQVATTGNDYISELAAEGYTSLTVDQLVEMKNVGVDAAYIRALRAAGFDHLTPRELIESRASDLRPAYVQAMRARFGALTLRQLGELSELGVTSSYIDDLASEGYRDLNSRQLIEAKAVGINKAFIDNAQAHGFKNLTLKQLIQLKTSGVL